MSCVVEEITECRQAEEALRESEQQLREAQKMEAVGRLTGGVAHDFNNLLQVITGNLELLQLRLKADKRAHVLIEEALGGAQRGAELTQRLLVFARKQRLEPTVINVNKLIIGMTKILRRTLGEDIEIETVKARRLWKTRVDANQLENTILNLAINARDAMPSGGQMTVESANVHLDDDFVATHPDVAPGAYVMLEVRDTGIGMPPEIARHAFEPFFTTKETGKGTGLGLSMVCGFVKQSGGHVTIESEVGVGTTVKLYLPRARGSRLAKHPPAKGTAAAVEGKTILVVEDDARVRRVVAKQLRELGYRAIGASDGRDALKVLSRDRRIDLIFTDVVMPGGMSGTDLVHKARERWPELKVVLTSGYAEDVIALQGAPDDELELLRKPYSSEDLSRKVHEALTP